MTTPRPAPEQLIQECQGLVHSLARSIHRKLPANVELEDLVAYGQIGLVEAARDFDPARGGRFSTYAYYRIRGAIYDGMAKMSWFGRGDQSRRKEECGQGDAVNAQDVTWFAEMTCAVAMVYLAGKGESNGEDEYALSVADRSSLTASSLAMIREMSQKLHNLIEALPPEAATLIRATYFEGMTLQEAGTKLGVSKSWASRLHAKTLERLAHSLKLQGVAT